MKIEWNKVTWYSKWLALFVFVAFSFIGFFLGVEYGKSVTLIEDSVKMNLCAQTSAQLNVYTKPQASSR